MMSELPVPKEALAWFKAKRLQPSFDYREVWGAEHTQMFTVAKATQLDVLTTLRDSVERALADGQTFEQFQRELTPTLQKLGWWGKPEVVDPQTGEVMQAQLGSPHRLRTIFQTNMRTARAAGQWERIQRTKALRPFLLYSLGPAGEHRQQHAAWAGTLLPVDHPFWSTHATPNGWGCKCRIRQVGKAEAARMADAKTEPPAGWDSTRPYVNQRTGEETQVPIGIDPGWAYNPGAGRSQALEKNLARALSTAHPADRAAAEKLWNS